MFRVGVSVLVALVALGGCHRETRSDDQRTASGQVLQGSTSDAMIAYEQLQSRPPLAPRVMTHAQGENRADSAVSGAEAGAGAIGEQPPEASGAAATVQ